LAEALLREPQKNPRDKIDPYSRYNQNDNFHNNKYSPADTKNAQMPEDCSNHLTLHHRLGPARLRKQHPKRPLKLPKTGNTSPSQHYLRRQLLIPLIDIENSDC
jgi:hypothetical protein